MYEAFSTLIGTISNVMYSYLLIIMLLAAGIYFSLRTGLVQLRMLPEAVRSVGERSGGKDSVSSFQALMVSTASRGGSG